MERHRGRGRGRRGVEYGRSRKVGQFVV